MRRGFTVALVGPDGSGKTTVARRLEGQLPLPVAVMYMSINPASGNHLLPTTWLGWVLRGRPQHIEAARWEHTFRTMSMAAEAVSMANQVAEEWYRALVACLMVRHSRIVVLDRHYYYDYFATDIVADGRRRTQRLHGYMLQRYPRPHLTIYLDAPPEVLLARKGEGTRESVCALRRELLEALRSTGGGVIIDGTQPLDDVVQQVIACISDFAQAYRDPPVAL